MMDDLDALIVSVRAMQRMRPPTGVSQNEVYDWDETMQDLIGLMWICRLVYSFTESRSWRCCYAASAAWREAWADGDLNENREPAEAVP